MANHRSVLVTGGGRGLGRAIAERLAGDDWDVGVLARTAAEVEETAAGISSSGGKAKAIVADVLDPGQLAGGVRSLEAWSGRIDALVCAAGRLKAIGPVEAVDLESWRLDLETTVVGTYQAIHAARPALAASGAGTIVVLVGPGHHEALAYASGYAAAQAAAVRLVEALERELRADGTRIYAVYPGIVPTPLVRHLLDSEDGRRWLPRFNEIFSEGKEVGPEVGAEMVAWLLDGRPPELSGRVVPAPLPPALLETRLARFEAENRGVLRLT